jgi:hypothetical protein
MFGELIGRCHRSLISFFKPSWLYDPTPELLWILSIIEICHLLFFIFESWYRFLPGVAMALVLCLTAGLIVGVFFNNMLEVLHATFEGKEREFVLGFTMAPAFLGILLAAIVGLYVEPRLTEHCIATVTDSAFCSTRSASFKDIIARCGTRNITTNM